MSNKDKGIDYGLRQTNVDRETGIRYGIISQHSINGDILGEFEPDYGEPTCPDCGNELREYDVVLDENLPIEGIGISSDFTCETCNQYVDCDGAFGEPLSHNYNSDGYKSFLDDHGDVWVMRSPYYTHAQFCSPCAPGACHLDNPVEEGNKAYCFGHDWFEGNVAPYPVYSVETGKRVYPELSEFVRGYVEACLWVNDPTPGSGEYEPEEELIEAIPAELLHSMANDCESFRSYYSKEASTYSLLQEAYKTGYTEGQAGQDFYLTRNRHGAGFWDRGLGDIGSKLTAIAKTFGSTDAEDLQIQEEVFHVQNSD